MMAVNVDAALLVVVERGPDGGVMDGGVAGGHLRAGPVLNAAKRLVVP